MESEEAICIWLPYLLKMLLEKYACKERNRYIKQMRVLTAKKCLLANVCDIILCHDIMICHEVCF